MVNYVRLRQLNLAVIQRFNVDADVVIQGALVLNVIFLQMYQIDRSIDALLGKGNIPPYT